MKKTVLITYSILSCIYAINAQEHLTIKLPENATPNLASLQRYTDHPVDLCYGLVQIEIPLYEIVEGDIRIPITLSYHSSGFRPYEGKGDYIGTGWMLNYGPTLSKSIQGASDSKVVYQSPSENYEYLEYIASGKRDNEPDIYNYKLLNSNGKFIIDKRNGFPYSFILNPYEPIKLDKSFVGTTEIFNIVDDYGFKYKFDKAISMVEETMQWGITKIQSPQNDSVIFRYTDGYTFNNSHISRRDMIVVEGAYYIWPTLSMEYVYGKNTRLKWPFLQVYSEREYNFYNIDIDYAYANLNGTVNSTKISGPQFDGGQRVLAYPVYVGPTPLLYECNILEIESNNTLVKFTLDMTPGQQVPYTLQRMDIIEKSSNETIRSIEFNVCKYNNTIEPRKKLEGIKIVDSSNNLIEKYGFDYYFQEKVKTNNPFTDYWGYFCWNLENSVNAVLEFGGIHKTVDPNNISGGLRDYTLHDINSGSTNFPINVTGAPIPTLNSTQIGVLKSITYPTGRKSTFEYELNKGYNPENSKITEQGGLRIKRIAEIDLNTSQGFIRDFVYGKDESGAGTIVNLMLDNKGKVSCLNPKAYMNENICVKPGGITPFYTYQKQYYSTPFLNSSVSVYYDEVTEYRKNITATEDMGKTTFKYSPVSKLNYRLEGTNFSYEYDFTYKYTNIAQGFLLEKTEYKKNIQENTYSSVFSLINKYKPFLVDELAYQKVYQNIEIMLAGTTIEDRKKIYDNISMSHSISPFITRNCTTKIGTTRRHSTEEIFYEDSEKYVSKKTEYEYDNLYHLYPTKTTVKNSNEQIITTTIKYPQDYSSSDNEEETARKKLIENNQINTPLYQSIKKGNDTWIDKIKYAVYDNGMALPKSFSSGFDGNLQEQIVCGKYDFKGNLLEYTTKDQLTTTIIWSYNHQYPIAEIKNATYDQVRNAINPGFLSYLQGTSNPMDIMISSLVKILQKNLPNSLVTTYTYKPLVGMTSMTDPRGITTYYEYDDFGRLKEVYVEETDASGNLQKKKAEEYEYHYKNQ